jgi:hypothetical protein
MPEDTATIARLGEPAPDFEAIAYADGDFKTIKLLWWSGSN